MVYHVHMHKYIPCLSAFTISSSCDPHAIYRMRKNLQGTFVTRTVICMTRRYRWFCSTSGVLDHIIPFHVPQHFYDKPETLFVVVGTVSASYQDT